MDRTEIRGCATPPQLHPEGLSKLSTPTALTCGCSSSPCHRCVILCAALAEGRTLGDVRVPAGPQASTHGAGMLGRQVCAKLLGQLQGRGGPSRLSAMTLGPAGMKGFVRSSRPGAQASCAIRVLLVIIRVLCGRHGQGPWHLASLGVCGSSSGCCAGITARGPGTLHQRHAVLRSVPRV